MPLIQVVTLVETEMALGTLGIMDRTPLTITVAVIITAAEAAEAAEVAEAAHQLPVALLTPQV